MADLMGERPAAPPMARGGGGGGVYPGIMALISALQAKFGPQGLVQLLTMLLQQGGQTPPDVEMGPPRGMPPQGPPQNGMGMMAGG